MSDISKHYIVQTFDNPVHVTTEKKYVFKNKILLDYIPDSTIGIVISGYVESKFNKTLTSDTQFYCNYDIGELVFYDTVPDNTLISNINYYGKGIIKYYDNRIAITDNKNVWDSNNLADFTDEIAEKYKAKEYTSDLDVIESSSIQIVICKEGTTIDAGNLPLSTIVVVR